MHQKYEPIAPAVNWQLCTSVYVIGQTRHKIMPMIIKWQAAHPWPHKAWFWGDNTIKEHLLWPKWDVTLGLACDFCGCTLRQKNGVIWAAFREREEQWIKIPYTIETSAAGSSKEHISLFRKTAAIGAGWVWSSVCHSRVRPFSAARAIARETCKQPQMPLNP